jgi:epoxyqueuosine reductase
VERRRGSQTLVRAGEVAALIPPAAGGDGGRSAGVEDLRRPRLLTDPVEIKQALRERTLAHGFDAFGIARPDAVPEAKARLERFIAEGAHGDMDWLADTATRRGAPNALWADVRSVIMLGMNYGPDGDPLAILKRRDRAAISIYAQGDDYHDLIKKRLKEIARWLVANAGGDVKVFVDTAAVMEKPLAAAASLGWQGKHTNLVSRDFGSWLFLGSIFTTLDLPADEAAAESCGTCRACLDVCPTAAFPEPFRLDARRCISYLTIEHKGPIPRELRPLIGNRIYGCDDCLAVCPWNKFAVQGREAKLASRDTLRAPKLAELARLDDAQFRALFSKSPVKRSGRDRFVRNVLIAIGNSGDASLAGEAERLLDDASPLVRGAAVWALSQLLPREKLSALAQQRDEHDVSVNDEWATALS